jgi:hypothetical protein
MPVIATMGALTYAKAYLSSENFESFYVEVLSSYTFNDISFDSSSNFYCYGLNNFNQPFTAKFRQSSPYPAGIIYTYSAIGAQPSTIIASKIKYNSYSDKIITLGSSYSTYIGRTYERASAYTNPLSFVPNSTSLYDPGANWPPPSAGITVARAYDCDIDPINGNYYEVGMTQVNGGTTKGTYIRKNSSSTSIAYVALGFITAGSILPFYDGTQSIKLLSDYNPVITYTRFITNTNYCAVVKLDKTPVAIVPGKFNLPMIWGRMLSLSLNTTLKTKLIRTDSSDNSYVILNDTGSINGYLVKYDSSGVIQWQRRISNVQLSGLYVTSAGDCYLTGVSSNKLWIAQYNNAGSIQWQNEMSGFTYTNPAVTLYNSSLYIAGNGTGKGFILKVPIAGTIPGTGSYYITGSGTTITYSTSSLTDSAGALIDAADATYQGSSPTYVPSTDSISNTPVSMYSTTISL